MQARGLEGGPLLLEGGAGARARRQGFLEGEGQVGGGMGGVEGLFLVHHVADCLARGEGEGLEREGRVRGALR